VPTTFSDVHQMDLNLTGAVPNNSRCNKVAWKSDHLPDMKVTQRLSEWQSSVNFLKKYC
jgi:hypothetical protein